MASHLSRMRQILKQGLLPGIAVLAILLLCSSYSQGQRLSGTGRNPAVTLLTPGQACELLNGGARDLVILDIRTPRRICHRTS